MLCSTVCFAFAHRFSFPTKRKIVNIESCINHGQD
jgi:hypothetical protein